MNEIYEAALYAQNVFVDQGWKSCVIDGLAVIRWGDPRTTQDADFSLLTGFGDEERFIDVLSREFHEREPDEAEFARRFRVYRGYAPNGAALDIALAGIPFEARMIDRASAYEFTPDCRLITCSAEDLIVLKAFAGRDQDWADVANVMSCQWGQLGWNVIDSELEEVCEIAENMTAVPKLSTLKQTLDQ